MSKINLLIIDDDKIFLSSSRAYLSVLEDEVNIIVIENPIEALEYAKSNEVDIVFVDYFMPQMTGDKFVSKLREFNDSVLVILQTGYADKKPPVEMLDSMNIQGYFDKTKSPEELEILVRATIKTYKLIQIIKQKDKEIDILNYKNEFMGGLIVGITDSLKNQTTAIGGATEIIKEVLKKKNIDECNEMLNTAQNCIEKESNILGALDFYTNPKGELKAVFEIVSTLSKVKLLMEKTNIKVNMDKTQLIKCKSNILIMILLEIIIYLSDNKAELIGMEVSQTDKNIIEVLNKFEYETSFINKIKTVSNEDDNIEIDYNSENKILKIYVEKV